MSLAGKQNTSQYHRIQASVSRQAAVCCGSKEHELRQRHLDAAKRHEEMAHHLAKVEGLLEAAGVEAESIERSFGIADGSLFTLTDAQRAVIFHALRQAYLAGREAEMWSH